MKRLALLASLLFACASQPPASKPKLIAVEGALENTFVKADQPRDLIARLRIQGLKLRRASRPRVNLVLLMDTSASMRGAPIQAAKTAAKRMMGQLEDEDRLSVVVFNSSAELLLPSTLLEEVSSEQRMKIIDKIRAVGTTDMIGGLKVAMRQVQKKRLEVNRIVLLSDGVPNRKANIQALAQDAGRRGIPITALGFGLDYDEVLLANIASASRGKFHFVEDASQIAQVFDSEVLNLKQVVARSAVLRLQPGPGIKVTEIIGQRGDRAVQLGELSEGDTRDVLIRLQLPARPAERTIELLDAKVRFSDVGGRAHTEHVFLMATSTSSAAQITQGRDDEVLRAAARAQAAAATLDVVHNVRNGDFEKAEAALNTLEQREPRNAPHSNVQALREAMPRLRSKKRSRTRQKDPDYVLRKSHSEAWNALH